MKLKEMTEQIMKILDISISAPVKRYWTFLELFQNISDFFGPEHPELSLKCSIHYQVHY